MLIKHKIGAVIVYKNVYFLISIVTVICIVCKKIKIINVCVMFKGIIDVQISLHIIK